MNEFPEFLIYAPPFTYKSAGCRALYRLCHLLNRSGTSARIIPYEPAGSEWDTPFLLPAVQDSVVIYPETVHGNPLWARKVVRWALNYPGNLGGDLIYGPDEMVFVYLRDMIPRVNCSTPEPLGPGRVLYVPVIDPKHIYPDPSVPKEIDSVFTYKGKELKRQFPTPPRDNLVRVEENTPTPS